MTHDPLGVLALGVASAVAVYLVVLGTSVATVRAGAGLRRFTAHVSRRPVLFGALGSLLTGLGLAPAAPAAAQDDPDHPPTARRLDVEPDADQSTPIARLRRLPDPPPATTAPSPTTTTTTTKPAATDPEPRPDPPPEQRQDERRQWIVQPGDNLWAIAAADLGAERSQAPTEDEIARHWSALIELNRPRLVDPGNPDLIVPGQRLHLPPRPAG